jgi:hypothetical protein
VLRDDARAAGVMPAVLAIADTLGAAIVQLAGVPSPDASDTDDRGRLLECVRGACQ